MKKQTRSKIFLITTLFFVLLSPKELDSQTRDSDLSDPIVLGAWLYEGNCIRCHMEYDEARLAEDYEDSDELMSAIEKDRCQINWGIIYGGSLRGADISALADYMMTWEELEESPPLPELPPQLKEEPILVQNEKSTISGQQANKSEENKENPRLMRVLEDNPLAKGAYLYTQNCYRCHLSYETYRMGQNFSRETIRQTINDGKIATQMTAFSKLKAGNLTDSEMDAITDYIVTWEKFGESLAVPSLVLAVPGEDPSALQPIGPPKFKPVSGEVKRGKQLYRQHCSICHGTNGEGYIGKPLNQTWWIKRFDLFAKSVIKKGVPNSLMKAWSESYDGPLGPEDIDDLVALIIDWEKHQASLKSVQVHPNHQVVTIKNVQ